MVRPVGPRPPERIPDALDAAASGATADLHDDAPLHNRPMQDEYPGLMSMVWEGGVDVVGVFVPSIRNFHRHVTRETLDHDQRGIQIFSSVTKGFPVVPTFSHQAYTGVVANWPSGANANALNAWIWQAAWTYREVERNPDRMQLATTADQAVTAIRSNRVAVQLGIEGAFPFDINEQDLRKLARFIDDHRDEFPATFPLPTAAELSSQAGFLAYAWRIGEQYIGLSHLVDSCFAAGGPLTDPTAGLTAEGRSLVRTMDAVGGTMLDLAHATPQGQRDVVAMVNAGEISKPVIVSHGLIAPPGKTPTWRDTLPETLQAIKKTGGIIGIIGARVHLPHGSWNGFDVLDWLLVWPFRLFGLDWHFPGWTNPMAFIDDIVDQIGYVRDAIGIDYVGLGLDGDGFVGMPLKNYAEMHDAIRARMRQRGYSAIDIDKVFCGNYLHVLQRRDDVLARRARPRPAVSTAMDVLRPQHASGVSAAAAFAR